MKLLDNALIVIASMVTGAAVNATLVTNGITIINDPGLTLIIAIVGIAAMGGLTIYDAISHPEATP